MNRFEPDKNPKPDPFKELKAFSDKDFREHGVGHWILDESGQVMPATLFEWCFWFERNGQRVIQQDYPGEHKVSTVFTGLDLSYTPEPNHVPLLFETMVFGREFYDKFWKRQMRKSLWTERTTSLKEALAAHKQGLEWLSDYLAETPPAERAKQELDSEGDEAGPGPDDVRDAQDPEDYRRSHQKPIEGGQESEH